MSKKMRLLAVDPGYDRCGIAVIDLEKHEPVLLHSRCITTDKNTSHALRLATVYSSLENSVKEYAIGTVALETLFFSINKKTALKVAEARGVALLLAGAHTLDIIELSPQEVKLGIAGSGSADKKQVKKMVELLLASSMEGKIDDEIDAIAIGLAAAAILQRKNFAK